MLQYMLDTNICIYAIKSRPIKLREPFNRLTEQICISTITLAELYYGVEKSSRRAQNHAHPVDTQGPHILIAPHVPVQARRLWFRTRPITPWWRLICWKITNRRDGEHEARRL